MTTPGTLFKPGLFFLALKYSLVTLELAHCYVRDSGNQSVLRTGNVSPGAVFFSTSRNPCSVQAGGGPKRVVYTGDEQQPEVGVRLRVKTQLLLAGQGRHTPQVA